MPEQIGWAIFEETFFNWLGNLIDAFHQIPEILESWYIYGFFSPSMQKRTQIRTDPIQPSKNVQCFIPGY